MADYALKKEKKKSKAPCVVCMVLYLIVALAVCTSYAARGGTAGSLKYKVLIKAARGLLHGEFFYGLKSLQNIKTGIIMLAQMWYVHVIVIGAMLMVFMGKVEYSFKGVEQGSAHWASDDEKKKFADPEGVPVAKGMYVSFNAGKEINKVKQAAITNTNKVVIATSGGGKTEGVIKPDVMQMIGNYFVIDPKGSVYQDCAYLLKKNGYNIRVLNFYDVDLSHHYNPYAYINSELDVINLGSDFMNATKEDGERNDYWTGAAEDFFTSLILYIYKSKDETNKSFERVVQILTSIDYQDRKLSPVCEYSLLMEKYAIDRENEGLDEDKVVLNYKGMKGLPQETLGGVVANLQKRLGLWYTEVVSKFTAEDEMEFDNFTKPNSKEAIFVIYPIGSTTFKPIISMFYQQFISRMKYMASQKCGGSLPVLLNIEADEICQISKIPTLKDDIATIRSLGMRMTFVCQSLTQLEAKYEKEAKDILSNCGIICFFGSRDDKIRKWLCEEQIGYTTFKVENKSYSKNGTNESEQGQRRLLITPDELDILCKEDDDYRGRGVFLVGFGRPFKTWKIRADEFHHAEDVYFSWHPEKRERCFTDIEKEFLPVKEAREKRKLEAQAEKERTVNTQLGEQFERDYNDADLVSVTDEDFFEEVYGEATVQYVKQDKKEKKKKGAVKVEFDKDALFQEVASEIEKRD
jgi:type IV secretion system protein VirD4